MHISSVFPFVTKSIHQKPKTPSLSREKTGILGYCHAARGYHVMCAVHRRVNTISSHLRSSGGKSRPDIDQGHLRVLSDSRFQSQTSETSGTAHRFRSQGDKFRDVIHLLPWTVPHLLTHYLSYMLLFDGPLDMKRI